jgi:alkylated DNA nucleotide flippase Atl1
VEDEDYVEAVLSVVERIPPGRVTTYGAIADALGRFGPRYVGRVMAHHGGSVPWWRVVRADGSLPPGHMEDARVQYAEEGTPFRPSGRVDMATAAWWPEHPDSP